MKVLYGLLLFLSLSTKLFAVTSQEYFAAGISLYQKAQYDQALPYFRAAVQIDPQNWQAFQMIGSTYYQQKDNASAITAINESLRINPDNPGLRNFLASLQPVNAGVPPPPAAPPEKKPKRSGNFFIGLAGGFDVPGSGWQQAYAKGGGNGEFSFALKIEPSLSVGLDVDIAIFGGTNYIGYVSDFEVRVLPTVRYRFDMGPFHPYVLAGAGMTFEGLSWSGGPDEISMNPDLTAGLGLEFDLNPGFEVFFQGKLNVIMTDPIIGMDLPLLAGLRFGM